MMLLLVGLWAIIIHFSCAISNKWEPCPCTNNDRSSTCQTCAVNKMAADPACCGKRKKITCFGFPMRSLAGTRAPKNGCCFAEGAHCFGCISSICYCDVKLTECFGPSVPHSSTIPSIPSSPPTTTPTTTSTPVTSTTTGVAITFDTRTVSHHDTPCTCMDDPQSPTCQSCALDKMAANDPACCGTPVFAYFGLSFPIQDTKGTAHSKDGCCFAHGTGCGGTFSVCYCHKSVTECFASNLPALTPASSTTSTSSTSPTTPTTSTISTTPTTSSTSTTSTTPTTSTTSTTPATSTTSSMPTTSTTTTTPTTLSTNTVSAIVAKPRPCTCMDDDQSPTCRSCALDKMAADDPACCGTPEFTYFGLSFPIQDTVGTAHPKDGCCFAHGAACVADFKGLCPEHYRPSARIMGGTPIKSSDTAIGHFNDKDHVICNLVYAYNPSGLDSTGSPLTEPVFYVPALCLKSLDILTRQTKEAALLKMTVGNYTCDYRKQNLARQSLQNSYFEASTLTSYNGTSLEPSCTYNPATMADDIDTTDCFLLSYGTDSLDEQGYPTFSGKLNKLEVRRVSQGNCADLSMGVIADCFVPSNDQGGYTCQGDYGAPVFCRLSTGETALYGVFGLNSACGASQRVFPVVPIN